MTSQLTQASTTRGTKRHCLNCTLPFYDLARSPVVCPNCGERFEHNVRPSPPPPSRPTAEKRATANVAGGNGTDLPAAVSTLPTETVDAVQDPSPETNPDVASVDDEVDTDDTEDDLLIDEDIDDDIEDEEIPKPESREGD